MSDPRAVEWARRATAAWAKASQIRTLYDRLAEIFYPEREDFHSEHSLGLDRYTRIMDAEPVLLRQELGDGIGGMLRPRDKDWFFAKVKPPERNEDYEVSAWLDHVNERLREELYKPRTRFETALKEADHDLVTFGTSVLSVTLNRRRDGLLFRCVHPRDIAFEVDEERHVSVVYEELRLTARQLARLFGERRLTTPMRQALQPGADQTQEFKLWRIVAPKEEHDWLAKPPTTATVASLYIDQNSHEFLAEAHMRVNPYQIRRWMDVSGEGWGRSPCTSAALADSNTLNEAQRALLEGLAKAIDPPMAASSKVQGSDINLYAGGVTYLGDVDDVHRHFRPVQDGARVDYGLEFTRERRQFLGRAMRQSLLRMPEEHQMTAYEASQRVDEWVRNASPVFGPMQQDNADLMERVISLAMFEMNDRSGLFDPPPESLRDGFAEITFEFEDRLAEARRRLKLYRTREFEQEIASHAQVVSGGDPEKARMVLAKVNWDEVLAAKREAYPTAWFKSPQEAAEAAELVELEHGGRRALEAAATARPEVLQAGLELLGGGDPLDAEYEEAAPAQPRAALPAPISGRALR